MTNDRKDAERYRYLRDKGIENWPLEELPYVVINEPGSPTARFVGFGRLEILIDAAIEALKEPTP